ncbi:MAG: NADH-quinone oxidoreductase subunit H [Candidatus Freyarchaeota archaeon]|nr:NADH-quinone oxidoreductase subunit H [Candidatus Jordarchaeia archaeon]
MSVDVLLFYLLAQQSTVLDVGKELFKILVFPGAIFMFALALVGEWFDRKVHGRLQHRVGPFYTGWHGILQPLADFIKLLAKEDIVARGADVKSLTATPIAAFTIALTMVMFLPVYKGAGIISFEGDLVFLIFLATMYTVTVILTGWFSTSRFGEVGTTRAGLQLIAFEVPLALSALTPAFVVANYMATPQQVAQVLTLLGVDLPGLTLEQYLLLYLLLSTFAPELWTFYVAPILQLQPFSALQVLTIGNITAFQAITRMPLILVAPISFASLLISLMAEMEKVPFDIPEAHTEIVAGWQTEISGKKLALFRAAGDLEMIFGAGLAATLFLGGPYGPGSMIGVTPLERMLGAFPLGYIIGLGWFLVKLFAVLFIITLLRTVFARFRIDQVTAGAWKYLIPLTILNIAVIEAAVYLDLFGWRTASTLIMIALSML